MFQFIRRWWKNQDRTTRELPGYLRQAVANFMRSGTHQAAALAYYAIFSVFPLALLLAVAIGKILGPAAAQEQVSNALSLFLPGMPPSFCKPMCPRRWSRGVRSRWWQ